MHWVVYNGVPVPVYVQVYKVVVDFGDVDVSKLVSGQYINFEGEVTGIDGRNVNINELYVKNDAATLGTIDLSFNGNRKKGTFTVEDFRVTGLRARNGTLCLIQTLTPLLQLMRR